MAMLTAGHMVNAQSLNTQAASLIYQIDTTIDYPSKYPSRPLTPNQIYNTSDAQLRRNEIYFIQNVIDTLRGGTGVNIYNSDGTLTGNRTANLNKHGLQMGDVNYFTANDTSGNVLWNFNAPGNNGMLNISSTDSTCQFQLQDGLGYIQLVKRSGVYAASLLAGSTQLFMESDHTISNIEMNVGGDEVQLTLDSTANNVSINAGNGLMINGYRLPIADGSAGQAMVTDGSGHVSFTTISGGGTTASNDVTGQTAAVPTLLSYSVPGGTSHTVEIGGYITITSGGGGQVAFNVAYTDENSVSQSYELGTVQTSVIGSNQLSCSSNGAYTIAKTPIRCHRSTTVTISLLLAGGPATFDGGATLDLKN